VISIVTTRCRQCQRSIRLARQRRRNAIVALDPEPHEAGTVRLLPDGSCQGVYRQALNAARAAGEVLYRLHYPHCPERDAWYCRPPERTDR